jgi:hypothetical protein
VWAATAAASSAAGHWSKQQHAHQPGRSGVPLLLRRPMCVACCCCWRLQAIVLVAGVASALDESCRRCVAAAGAGGTASAEQKLARAVCLNQGMLLLVAT